MSRHVYQAKRVTIGNICSRRMSIDKVVVSPAGRKKISIRTQSLAIKSDLEEWYDSFSSPIQRCASPDTLWPCTGNCLPSVPQEANVISLSACEDNQLSYEDSDGASMTTALIKILKKNPHPTVHDLVTGVSHELHTFYLRVHDIARRYRKGVRRVNKKREAMGLQKRDTVNEPPEMDNFQDPQISSHRPIPKETKWNP